MAKEILFDDSSTKLLIQPEEVELESALSQTLAHEADLQVELNEPGKSLSIYFGSKDKVILTRITNTQERIAQPGSTTALYFRALSAMQQVANFTGVNWHYQFATQNERMQEWALDPSKGRAIFTWEDLDVIADNILTASTTISPILDLTTKKID